MLAVLQDVSLVVNDKLLLEGLSFQVRPGRVGAVVSTREAERSALLGLIAGLCSPSSGILRVRGRAVLLRESSPNALLQLGRKALEVLEEGASIVLLDLPFEALTRSERQALIQTLREGIKDKEASVILGSASYDSVYGLADCIFMLWRGRLVWSGCAAEASPNNADVDDMAQVLQIDYRPIPGSQEMMVESLRETDSVVGLSLVSERGESVKVVLPKDDADYLGLRLGQIVYTRFGTN